MANGNKKIGQYVKRNVIPEGMTVKHAAKLLGVSRPALSNFLNGKSALTPKMAARLQQAFGADPKQLLQMFTTNLASKSVLERQLVASKGYAPSVCEITAYDFALWANKRAARYEFPALVRQLVKSTANDLRKCDFPAYEQSERPGFDGTVEAIYPTPWVPEGLSGWELSCADNTKQKADSDYAKRSGSKIIDHASTTFVFATPRNWPGKDVWCEEKKQDNIWRDVRAYDASDLEQWIEGSAPTQAWFARKIDKQVDGLKSLTKCKEIWSNATKPLLSPKLFSHAIEQHQETFTEWLNDVETEKAFVIAADSPDEALAFLAYMFDELEHDNNYAGSNVIVFDSVDTLLKMKSASKEAFIAVLPTEELYKKWDENCKHIRAIFICKKNLLVRSKPHINLDRPSSHAFHSALIYMGYDNDKASLLAQKTGRSPTILRRELAIEEKFRTWESDTEVIKAIIPACLAGTWDGDNEHDKRFICKLSGEKNYADYESQLTKIEVAHQDIPIWLLNNKRGVVSKLDTLYGAAIGFRKSDFDTFFSEAKKVLLSPLHVPIEGFPSIVRTLNEYSPALRKGVLDTILLLSVHGNELFTQRIGINLMSVISELVKELLDPFCERVELFVGEELSCLAEAAPKVFLSLVENAIKADEKQIENIISQDSTVLMGCKRTGLLWSLEQLACLSDCKLLRIVDILAKLSKFQINDNYANTPIATLQTLLSSWAPQTSATLEERISCLKYLGKEYPDVAWILCIKEFDRFNNIAWVNSRPTWHEVPKEVNKEITRTEMKKYLGEAAKICLEYPNHNESTICQLVERIEKFHELGVHGKVFNLIEKWIESNPPKEAKKKLRAAVRNFAPINGLPRFDISPSIAKRAGTIYNKLEPDNMVEKHLWLFTGQNIEAFVDLSEEHDYQKITERRDGMLKNALQVIWGGYQFVGVIDLLKQNADPWKVGVILSKIVTNQADISAFVKSCLENKDDKYVSAVEICLSGFLHAIEEQCLNKITSEFLKSHSNIEQNTVTLFRAVPFNKTTWGQISKHPSNIQSIFWDNVQVYKPIPDGLACIAVDNMIKANRQIEILDSIYLNNFKVIDTARIINLLFSMNNSRTDYSSLTEAAISVAFDVLDRRPDPDFEEMALLEIKFFKELEHSRRGIPFLNRYIANNPTFFVNLIVLVSRHDNSDEVLEQFKLFNLAGKNNGAKLASRLLDKIKPDFRDDNNNEPMSISTNMLMKWMTEVRKNCEALALLDDCDYHIGGLLHRLSKEYGNIVPPKAVCEVLDSILRMNAQAAQGFIIEAINTISDGMFVKCTGGKREKGISQQYQQASTSIKHVYPFTASILEEIAEDFERTSRDKKVRADMRRLRI